MIYYYLIRGSKNGVTIYDDVINTEKIKRPPTIVVFPKNKTILNFIVDVTYADFTATLDVPTWSPKAECYIIPPYKPVMHIGHKKDKGADFDIYVLRGSKTHRKQEHTLLFPPP